MGAENEVLLLPPEMMNGTGPDGAALLYNPGTEAVPMIIQVAGNTTDLIISNKTTGQKCIIHPLTEGVTIEVNGETGRVERIGETKTLAFDLHDGGYISLAACTPYVEDVRIRYTAGSSTIGSAGLFTTEMVGQYVYLNGQWRKLTAWANENEMNIHTTMETSGEEETKIVTMNEIAIEGIPSMLKFDYEPRVR